MHDREHALLRLAREDLERLHAGSRSGTASRSSRAPMPARAADSLTAHVMPAPPRSCSPSSRPELDQLERRLDQQLLGERVADLHARARRLADVVERRAREHAHAADAVAAGRRAVEHHERAGVRGERRARSRARRPRRGPTHITSTVGIGRVRLARSGSRRPRWARRCSCRSRRCRRPRPRAASGSAARSSGPNISGSSSATGRAPIETMSRTMPPTPVAAPW